MSENNHYFTWRGAILKSNLPSTTRHVLLTLGCHMNDVGESCYPSIDLLCQETGLSNRAVITHLHKAHEFGWIKIARHGFGDSRYWRNEYKISWPTNDDFKDKKDNNIVNDVHQGLAIHGERGAPTTVNDVHTSTSCNSPLVSTNVETTQCARENASVVFTEQESKILYSNLLSGRPDWDMVNALLKAGVPCQSANPILQKWVEDKVPIAFLLQCLAIARMTLQKPYPEKIRFNYLVQVVIGESKPKKAEITWLLTEKDTLAKGEEVGIYPDPGESWQSYRQRLRQACEVDAAA